MRRLSAISISAVLLSAMVPLQAASQTDRFGKGSAYAGMQGGTLGVGVNAGYDFSKDLGIRGLYNHFNLDFDEEEAGNEYDGKLRLRSLGLLLDWHPFWGTFHVSGGAFLNNTRLSASTEGVALGIGGGEYDAELDFRMKFERFAPYLGIGWTTGRDRKGLSFSADVGALFRSTRRRSASGRADGCGFTVSVGGDAEVDCSGVAGTVAGELRDDLEREHRELRNDLDKFKVYPAVSLGVSYRF